MKAFHVWSILAAMFHTSRMSPILYTDDSKGYNRIKHKNQRQKRKKARR